MPCGGYEDKLSDCYQDKAEATRVACELYRALRKLGHSLDDWNCSQETRYWVRDHEREDRRRIKRENEARELRKLKKKVLKKLSHKEREALGI